MVVPIERVSRADKSKKFIGNNLNVSLSTNSSGLQVTGNNCRVKISENCARVKVIGDNCEITVLNGEGDILYIGNCGKISLGPRVPDDVLSYIGNEGEISNAIITTDDSKNCDDPAQKSSPKNDREGSKVKGGNTAGSRISVCNSNVIRIATSCIPDTIDFSVPSIRISRNRHCQKHK